MFGVMPEELTWAVVQEREADAQRAVARASRRRHDRSLRAALARKLVQTGVWLDERARDAAAEPAAKNGCC